MAINTKKAKKVLTKAEQKHLTQDAGIRSMDAMRRQVEFMKGDEFACFECKMIARKLGFAI